MTVDAVSGSRPRSVAVLGAGTMGTGIALTFAKVGIPVTVTARRTTTLDAARRRLDDSLELMEQHDFIRDGTTSDIADLVSMEIVGSLDFEVDLIVESIPEDVDAKLEIFHLAESRGLPTTVITTNTSSLSLRELARAFDRPERFAGFHWFNPPELVELVEIIPGPSTDRAVLDTLARWSWSAGKQPVVVSTEIEGFIANRLQYALMREAYSLVEDGVCSFGDVDRVMRACLGPRWAGVGPFEAMDLAGLDIHLEVARRLFPILSDRTDAPSILERLVEKGALGTKTGRGLHGDYTQAAIDRVRERRIAALAALSSLLDVGQPQDA